MGWTIFYVLVAVFNFVFAFIPPIDYFCVFNVIAGLFGLYLAYVEYKEVKNV